MLGCQDRYGRQYTESIGREEDNALGSRALGEGLNDVLDVVDRIRNAGILGYRFVGKVDSTVFVYRYVFQKSVAFDGVVDVGLVLFAQVDNLGIATAFEVEYAFVVPSVLVVADKQTFRVGRESCLPVPERPKKIAVFWPFMSVLAEQCIEAMPRNGSR